MKNYLARIFRTEWPMLAGAAVALAFVIAVLVFATAANAGSIAYIANGGTGTSTPPGLNELYIGDAAGNLEYVATSSLNITANVSAITGIGPAGQVQTGNTQTLASTTLSFNGITLGLTIRGSGNTITFTPSASGTLNNSGLSNPSLTVNGTAISLGSSGLITAASSTLLIDSSTFSGADSFTNGSANFGGTWQTFSPSHFLTSAGAVTSLSGTANQIAASGSTGSVTLSLPSFLSIQAASSTMQSIIDGLYVGTTATTSIDSVGDLTLGGWLAGAGLTSCSGATNALIWNSSTKNFGCNTISGGGSGTVTSVGLSSSNSTLTIGSTPVTTSGTITADLNLSHANAWAALQTFAAKIGVSTTTPVYALSVGTQGGTYGSIISVENTLATTTSMTVEWSAGNQQRVQIGNSATSIAFSNVFDGATLRLMVCNPPSSSAGAISFTGVHWAGGTAPTQTTTANQCDLWSFFASAGTSTSATSVSVYGAASLGFQ